MQELPPLALVKTWLEVVQQLDFPISIREKRGKLLTILAQLNKLKGM